jgi:hypothetical protein
LGTNGLPEYLSFFTRTGQPSSNEAHKRDDIQGNAYSFELPNLGTTGDNLELTGWSHTRDYAYGFVNANEGQLSYARVHQLTPGQLYEYALYQFDNQPEDTKNDGNYRFGYIEWYINNVSQIDLLQEAGPNVASRNQPTVRGVAMANDQGEIVFKFKNNRGYWSTRSCIHVNLSGMSVVKFSGIVPPLSPAWVRDATHAIPDAYPSNGLKAWYCPGEIGASNSQWKDCSANGNHATLSSGSGGFTTGTHYAFQDQTITGTTRALYGTTSQTIDFGSVLDEVFTLCSVARYAGGTRRRIIQGKTSNWLHGHWQREAGVILYGGWKTAPRSRQTYNNFGSSLGARLAPKGIDGVYGYAQKSEWVVACTNGARKGEVTNTNDVVLLNGIDFGNGLLWSNSDETGFRVNGGGETSDFGIVEVVVWDRALSDSELRDASAHLMEQMGMSLPPEYPTYQGRGSINADSNGDCGEKTYHSSGWELGEYSSVTDSLDIYSDHYKKWVTRAVHYCLLYDSGSTHVSVWADAGYQCFKADSYGKDCWRIDTHVTNKATYAIAAPPSPPPAPPAPPSLPTDVPADVVWQSTVHSHCATNPSPGTLQKTSGTNSWTCAAFTNAPPYQIPAYGGFRAIEFRCSCTSNIVNIGLQAASADWSTWESNIAGTCNTNGDCGYFVYGIAYGFSCREQGKLYIHYDNNEHYEEKGTYTADSVLRVEAIGNTVTWYRDGAQLKTTTESAVSYPLNVFATIHNPDASCTPVTNLQLSPPSRFHLRTTVRTWQAAKQACADEGMTLASVFSAEEDQQINALVNNQVEFVWLGGNDVASEGNWVWDASGESIGPYTNWANNEPNNEGGIEHVMLKDFRPNPPAWVDAKDFYERAYVCQE